MEIHPMFVEIILIEPKWWTDKSIPDNLFMKISLRSLLVKCLSICDDSSCTQKCILELYPIKCDFKSPVDPSSWTRSITVLEKKNLVFIGNTSHYWSWSVISHCSSAQTLTWKKPVFTAAEMPRYICAASVWWERGRRRVWASLP